MDKSFFRFLPALVELLLPASPAIGRIAHPIAPAVIPRATRDRGKGGKRPHRVGNGSRRVKRAAMKARNVDRHKAACKGHANVF